MPRQTSVQLTEATEKQIDWLKGIGYGNFTDIARIAIDRMYREEMNQMNETPVYTTFYIVSEDGTIPL